MSGSIHIQHVLLSLQPGGLENGVVNVVNGLNPRRFQSSICCLKQAGEFARRIPPNRAQIHEMGLRGGNDLLLPLRLAQLFRRTKTDIVHTRNPEAFFYGFLGAKLGGVRAVIHSEHGRIFPEKPHRKLLQRFFSRFTDRIFAVSQQLKRDLVTHIGLSAARIEVLYNGVEPNTFHGRYRPATRRELGVRDSEIVIGSVGRLAPVKNYAILLNAVAGLGANHDVSVVLVGEGPERPVLEALADRLQIRRQVRFLGHRNDVPALLDGMDIFVLPSQSEGMSNTVLEAMAAGVPVVASDAGGNTEIVRDKQDGLIFPRDDIEQLRVCLAILCDDSAYREHLGRSGYARVMQAFSIQAMIARYEELYIKTFEETGGART
jgi:sugar transferase (PEP-CTERM/EpsH1 system associated)